MTRLTRPGAAGLLIVLGLASCGPDAGPHGGRGVVPTALTVSSPDIRGGKFDPQYTCDGGDHVPLITWTAGPAATSGYYLEMTDPDAGDFKHWIMYRIPRAARSTADAIAMNAAQATNGFGRAGYGGPCPPPAAPHHYVIRVYALYTQVLDEVGATQFKGSDLGSGELTATYARPS